MFIIVSSLLEAYECLSAMYNLETDVKYHKEPTTWNSFIKACNEF